ARTMARILGINEDLAEAAALAHDLGHPPYGHGGEAVLNELMAGHGGFEHNQQSLRIVEYLEHPYPGFRGLNLTYETRECLAKHQSRYDLPGKSEEFGAGRGSLEGQVADLADAIAYNSHDLDDALAAGLIGEADLREVELYQILVEKVGEQYGEMKQQVRQLRCAKGLIDLLAVDALEEADRRLAAEKPGGVDEVRGAGRTMVDLSGAGRGRLDQLEEFLMEKVYLHEQVVEAQKRAGEELRFLFEKYLKEPGLMPERYGERIGGEGEYRVVCDYIAGMTDRYCRGLYEEMKISGK
ncbi:MAG: HD domain-containing protein, partial [Planctomycetes bacterium]|nr:HD domain-containing protein [Planctomycetota bacterium]